MGITSNGELYSINYQRSLVNWFSTISIGTDRKSSELFYSSPIVYKNDSIFFSTSVATYAIDSRNSSIKWQLPFSTFLRPIVTDDFVFLASKNGFFLKNLCPDRYSICKFRWVDQNIFSIQAM